jgi:hypothetical protein
MTTANVYVVVAPLAGSVVVETISPPASRKRGGPAAAAELSTPTVYDPINDLVITVVGISHEYGIVIVHVNAVPLPVAYLEASSS